MKRLLIVLITSLARQERNCSGIAAELQRNHVPRLNVSDRVQTDVNIDIIDEFQRWRQAMMDEA